MRWWLHKKTCVIVPDMLLMNPIAEFNNNEVNPIPTQMQLQFIVYRSAAFAFKLFHPWASL